MDAPPGKRFVKLNDGRTIQVSVEDARKYVYYGEAGRVMRRARVEAPPPAPKPVASPAVAPRPQAPRFTTDPPPARPSPPPTAAAPPPVRPSPPPTAPAPPPVRPSPPPASVPAAQAPRPPPPSPSPPPPPAPIVLPRASPPPAAPPPPPPRVAPPPSKAARFPVRRRPAAAAPRPPLTSPALTYNLRAAIVAVILVLLILSSMPVFEKYAQLLHYNPHTSNYVTVPRTAEFNITRTFAMGAPGGTVSYNLNLAIPYDIPGMQDLVEVVETPVHTGEGTKWWWNATVPGGGSSSVSVRYHLQMTTFVWNLKAEDVGTAADVPASYATRYLDEEWKINPNSAAVRALADQITDRSKPYLTQIDDLYHFLLSPPYTYQATSNFEPQTPEETIARHGGDCDDFSVLFISMARYLGIPAWLELGLLYDQFADQSGRGGWGAHGWATVYIPLKAGGGVEATVDVVNKLFLIRDPYHFSDWSADGDAQHLQDYYTLLSYAPQTSPPFSVTQSITHDSFKTSGVVNYFHP